MGWLRLGGDEDGLARDFYESPTQAQLSAVLARNEIRSQVFGSVWNQVYSQTLNAVWGSTLRVA